MCSILAVLPPIVDAYSVYYFENTDSPNVFWVNMSKLNFTKGAAIKKLPLKNGEIYAGDVSGKFIVSKLFFSQ